MMCVVIVIPAIVDWNNYQFPTMLTLCNIVHSYPAWLYTILLSY